MAKIQGIIPADAIIFKDEKGNWSWLRPGDYREYRKIVDEYGSIGKYEEAMRKRKEQYERVVAKLEKYFKVPGTDKYDVVKAYLSPRISDEELKAVFGPEVVDKVGRFVATTAKYRISAYPEKPEPMPRRELIEFMKPEGVSDADYRKIADYIDNRGQIDIVAAISAGVPDKVIKKVTGVTDAELADLKWQAEYEDANFAKKLVMTAERDPVTFTKTVAESLVPVYGTAKFWKDMRPWERGLSVLGDVLFFVPVVSGISAGLKTGMGLSRAALMTARGVIVAPITQMMHPIETLKAALGPIETLLRAKKIPLGIVWRGEYAPMAIAKVTAGEVPRITRDAMAEIVRLANEGKTAKVRLPTGEEIVYSDTGLQRILGATSIHTSAGWPHAGKGVIVETKAEPAMFVAPTGYYKLTMGSATGLAPKFAMKGQEIIGDLADAGKVMDKHGKIIGRIKEGTKALSLEGKVIGELDKAGNIVKEGKVVGKLTAGGGVVKDGRIVGWIKTGADIVNEEGKTIAKLKSLPHIILIRNQGIRELPEEILKAPTMAEMEKRAERALKAGKIEPGIYPVYKQYKKYIELEGIIPPKTRIIPVLDKKGKPVVLWTRGIGGERIPVLLLQEVSKDWLERSLRLTKALKGIKVPKAKLNFGKVRRLPKGAAEAVKDWFKGRRDAVIYGSFAEYSQVGGRIPNDIDAAVRAPMKSARELAKIIESKSGVRTRVVATPKGGAAVEVFARGFWEKAIDLHPLSILKKRLPYGLKPLEPITVDGVRMEAIPTQIARLVARASEEWGEAPVRLAQIAKKLGVDVELGIGARAPTLAQLYKLKARGVYNWVRDLFVPGLTKKERIRLAKGIAPDLVDDFAELSDMEKHLEVARRVADTGRALPAQTARAMRGILGTRRTVTAGDVRAYRRRVEYVRNRLRARLENRAKVLRELLERLPARYSPEARRIFDRLVGPRRLVRMALPRITETRAGRVAMRMEPMRLPRELRIVGVRERLPVREVTPVVTRSPRIPPPPRYPPPTPTLRRVKRKAVERKPVGDGIITWRQGALKRGKKLLDVWWVIKKPWKSKKDVEVLLGEPPKGAKIVKGPESAYKTIQSLGGRPDIVLHLDLGAFDVKIMRPTRDNRKAIRFKPDPGLRTKGDIQLKGVRAK